MSSLETPLQLRENVQVHKTLFEHLIPFENGLPRMVAESEVRVAFKGVREHMHSGALDARDGFAANLKIGEIYPLFVTLRAVNRSRRNCNAPQRSDIRGKG